ncbi:MAG: hypothetical protein ACRD1K_20575 [Acidimicrobiales bacterium]
MEGLLNPINAGEVNRIASEVSAVVTELAQLRALAEAVRAFQAEASVTLNPRATTAWAGVAATLSAIAKQTAAR